MKIMGTVLALVLFVAISKSDEIVVHQVKGDVKVRSGVDEDWQATAAGDELKPHDSIRTGRKGSAVLLIRSKGDGGIISRKIKIPAEVLLDLSDVRDLSQEELMLTLTMERVRASSYEWKSSELHIPNATVIHGEKPVAQAVLKADDKELAALQMNGTKVLFAYGFYPTCALKALRIMERFPSLHEKFEHRFMVAESLERSHLKGEALSEYVTLSSTDLTTEQRSAVQAKIILLKKKG